MMHREGDQQVSDERIVADRGGGVVHDPALTPDLDARWFDRAYWRQRNALQSLPGGRGGVAVVETPAGAAFLRHYRRGGSVARLLGDRYLWTGCPDVRSVAEYRMLRHLHGAGLPVPQPLGGAWKRSGPYYRADLLTRRVAGGRPLSADLGPLLADAGMAQRIGACIGRFHAFGAFHADLNAHNILVDDAQRISLIDFDRGRIVPPESAWQQANLRRLHRSLVKLAEADDLGMDWQSDWWDSLLQAHAQVVCAQ